MKFLIKLVSTPVVILLTLIVWIFSAMLYISSYVFGLLSTIIGLLGFAVLVTYSAKNGCILFVLAFLISPLGLPMCAAWLLGKLQCLRYSIPSFL